MQPNELKREIQVDGRKFILLKNSEYGFWTVQSQNGHIFDGTYTTINAAKLACSKLAKERPPQIKY